MQRDPQFLASLQRLLEQECSVHAEYISLLEKEQKAMTAFKADEVTQLAAKREKLAEQMQSIEEKRKEFMKRFPDAENAKLSELIVKHCHPEDARKLSPLVSKLKKLITQSRGVGSELRQVANFSLNLIDGTLSIIWSATQNVTRAYSKKGVLKETYQSIKAGLLKQV
jgi:hypothetical protein